jgi:ribonuclease HI
LYVDEASFFSGKEFIGQGANNLGEITTLFLLLKSALAKGILTLQVFSDSELTIRWMKGDLQIQRTEILNLAKHLKDISSVFHSVSYDHVYRQFNSLAKESLFVAISSAIFTVIKVEVSE